MSKQFSLRCGKNLHMRIFVLHQLLETFLLDVFDGYPTCDHLLRALVLSYTLAISTVILQSTKD